MLTCFRLWRTDPASKQRWPTASAFGWPGVPSPIAIKRQITETSFLGSKTQVPAPNHTVQDLKTIFTDLNLPGVVSGIKAEHLGNACCIYFWLEVSLPTYHDIGSFL